MGKIVEERRGPKWDHEICKNSQVESMTSDGGPRLQG